MNTPLSPPWRLDELTVKGYRVYQDPQGFCFGVDAVLLAHFARVRHTHRVMDLCTGSGVIPLLLHGHQQPQHITGLELQPALAEMAQRSVALNGLEESIDIICGDVRDRSLLASLAPVHAVTCNPPYHPVGSGDLGAHEGQNLARFELSVTLEEVVQAAATLLVSGGHCYMVHLPKRLPELLASFERHKLRPKRLLMVHAQADKPATLVLVDGVKGGKAALDVLPPLLLQGEDGQESPRLRALYEGGLL